MDLDRSLLKEFAKVVNDVSDKPEPKQYVYGTVTTGAGNTKCVMLDGSDTMTPISEVVNAEAGDRVLVSVSNHQATVIGNITFPPSARKEDQAIESANGALNQSNQAMEKAKDAQTKASSAITDSSVASALANEAKTESAKAQEAANTAIQNAGEAKQLAQASSDKSDETQQLVNQVKDSVTAANKDISALKTEVKTANDNIASANTKLDTQAGEIATIKETYSTKVETESTKADLTTEISKQVGALQTTVEKNFATKTENVALEKKLQTQITQNADSISSTVTKVEKLESDTTEQQKNIDKALSDAQAAQKSADSANITASNAKTAADTAQKAADTATANAASAQKAADLANEKVTAADKNLQSAKTDLKEAQENLKNVTSRVDATEQEIADAKQKVDVANTNVTQALKDVAEANAAANKANEVASKAQGEATAANKAASDAQTKAADAQKVANQASADALKAQDDLAALTNRVTKAETNITQTNEAITAQATKITETSNKIDNLQIGGRNLLRNTAFKDFEKYEGVYVDNKYTKFSNNTLKLICDNTSGTSQKYTVANRLKFTCDLADVLGQDITLSMWIYIETVGQLDRYEFRILYTHNGNYQWFNPNRSYPVCVPNASELKVGWNYIYATFRVAEDSTEVEFNFTCYSLPGKKSICWISSPKAEFGNKPTAWAPAPEDLENDLHNNYYSKTETDAQIKVATDGIKLSVSETYITKTEGKDITNAANNALTNSAQAKKDAESALTKAQDIVDKVNSGELDGEDAVMLYIDSSNGTTFKNSDVATIFSVTVYVGGIAITDSAKLKEVFGQGAYLQWLIKRYGETEFTKIPLDDSRLNDNGFMFTLNAKDIKFKAVFNCELII